MDNFVAFFNTFLSYLLMYIVFGACIIAAIFAGIAVRKRKNAAADTAQTADQASDESQK